MTEKISRDETIRVLVNETEECIDNMRTIIETGSYFVFGDVKNKFETMIKLMEEKDYFPIREIDRLREEYNSIVSPRLLQHLEDCRY